MPMAWLFYGPPGCGKSRWIEKQAVLADAQLYHWNARGDRTLREGREMLHQQVRSQNKVYVWIEGADDLIPEAQAFLRRILETASVSVQCILECRDPSKISPAIQSRCEWKQAGSTMSFRRLEQKGVRVGAVMDTVTSSQKVNSKSILDLYKSAENPIDSLQGYVADPRYIGSPLWKQALVSLKGVGGGSSAWAHLAYLKALERSREEKPRSTCKISIRDEG